MMMGIIIKDLSNKLSKHIEEKGGQVLIDSNWVNDWLNKNNAEFVTCIVDENGNEIKKASVSIKKK
jgi:hypothetical protein